jgi:hypothetical protein
MSGSGTDDPKGRVAPGIPPGVVASVISILEQSKGPVRRRKLVEELDRRGHRVSLAGVNRLLQHLLETGRTSESPEGVQLRR